MTTPAGATQLRAPIDGRPRRMFIYGAWVDATSGATMPTLDPGGRPR